MVSVKVLNLMSHSLNIRSVNMKFYIYAVAQFSCQAIMLRECKTEQEAQESLRMFINLSNSGAAFYIAKGR